MQRNALFLYGNQGEKFLEFLSRSIAFDQPVILPSGYDIFSEQSLLQFFLFPRAVIGCPCSSFLEGEKASSACQACLLDPQRSVIAIGAFPPASILEGEKQFIPYTESDWYHGLYVPRGAPGNSSERFIHMSYPLLPALLIDALLLGLIFLLGMLIVLNVEPKLNWSELIAPSFPIGVGGITLPIFILSWLGHHITLVSYLSVICVLITGSAFTLWRRHVKLPPAIPRITEKAINTDDHPRLYRYILIGILVTITAASLIIAAIRGYSSFDGIANWALKGYAIAETGSVYAGNTWGGHGLSYPQNIHLIIALFRLSDGDVVPGSKLVFPLFCLSLLFGCYHFWVNRGVKKDISFLGSLMLFSVPFFFEHTTLGWANLPFSTYLVLGVLYLLRSLEQKNSKYSFLSGLLIAFAVWTRPEGIGYAITLLVIFLVARGVMKTSWQKVIIWIVPTLIIATLWLLFSVHSIAGDEIGIVLRSLWNGIIVCEFHIDALVQIVMYSLTRFTTINTWGILLICILVLLVEGIIVNRTYKQPYLIIVFCISIVFLIIPLFMFYATSFRLNDLTVFLSVSFDRAQFHGIILLFTTAFVGFFNFSEKKTDLQQAK